MERNRSTEHYQRTEIRPSWRSLIPSAIVATVVSGAMIYWMSLAELGALRIPIEISGRAGNLVFPLFLLVFLVIMARPLVALVDSVHIIGAHHLYSIVGRCSLARREIEVPYEDMRGVRSEQSILDRILNIGTVVVWTATAESAAERLARVYNPKAVVELIIERIDHARMKSPNALPGQDLEDQTMRGPDGHELRAG